MVKLQPSKLLMRVRFPHPALLCFSEKEIEGSEVRQRDEKERCQRVAELRRSEAETADSLTPLLSISEKEIEESVVRCCDRLGSKTSEWPTHG